MYKVSKIKFKEGDITVFKNVFKRLRYGRGRVMKYPDSMLMAVYFPKIDKWIVVETVWMKRG